ncbi:MAG: DUF4139 domain-containing protein [Anaerohalosphaera sp.]|nr:DUF4139 domain-containing protein [Anaerohalosphaera sp.]
MKKIIMLSLLLTAAAPSIAKVDLVTLPNRDFTQVTIYNSADLTLVRDMRNLTLKEGSNKLQFSWANTLIDPTSLSMLPKKNADKIDISDLTFPPRVKNLGLWNINSEVAGKTPIEITYLTSGLSWRAFYMGTLAEDEKTMRLQGYVRVTNNSGEDYENAQTRLIVGKVHLLDRIADLARRNEPYGRPGLPVVTNKVRYAGFAVIELKSMDELSTKLSFGSGLKAKEIRKEGLSEYFLYTIEGTETIPNQWSKRLPSFDVDDIPVINLYKQTGLAAASYSNPVIRYLSFKNDTDHQLGDTPIPGGAMKVYRGVDAQGHLSYEGRSSFKYIPVNEDIELNLGAVTDVIVTSKLTDYRTASYRYDGDGDIAGYDEIFTVSITVKNTRDLPIEIELKRQTATSHWDIESNKDADKYYEKIDVDTFKYTLNLEPQSEKAVEYELTKYHGLRTENRSANK